MPFKTLRKITTAVMILTAVLPLIGGGIWLFNNRIFGAATAASLYIGGFVSLLVYIIAISKEHITLKENIPAYIITLGIIIFAILSAVFSFDVSKSFYGVSGRFEGVFAITSYAGIFLAATAVFEKNDVIKIFDVIVGVGILQAIIAVLQHFGVVYSYYEGLDTLAMSDVYLAAGTSANPVFYGAFITLVAAIALGGCIFDKALPRQIIYFIATLLCTYTAFLTDSIVPIIGIAAAILIILVFTVVLNIKNKEKVKFFSSSIFRMIGTFLAIFAISVTMIFTHGLHFYDKGIAWQDSFYKLFISGQLSAIQDDENLYTKTWPQTLEIIKKYPLLGTGEDCLIIPQLPDNNLNGSVNTFDRPYNNYLYVAATRGIPSLLLNLALIVLCFIRMIKDFKNLKNYSSTWFRTALFTSLSVYFIVMFFSDSSVLVSPYFYILFGLSFCKKLDITKEVSNK